MKHILLIDDDEAVRLAVAFLLESHGFSVLTARNGGDGLRRCEERLPDLVITDVMMPDVDGIETIMALRRAYTHLPIIAISGGWHPGDERLLTMVDMLGATETLAKPFDCNALLSAVDRCLERAPSFCAAASAPLVQPLDDQRFASLVKRHVDARAAR